MNGIRSHLTKKVIKYKIIYIIYADLREFNINKELFVDFRQKSDDLRELQNLFADLASLPLDPCMEVFVIYNTLKMPRRNMVEGTFVLKLKERKGSQNEFIVVNKYTTRNFIQKSHLLTKALRFVRNSYVSEHIMLITWDHGKVYGIFSEELREAIRIPKKEFIRRLNSRILKHEVSFSNEEFMGELDKAMLRSKELTMADDFLKTNNRPEASSSELMIRQKRGQRPFKDILTMNELRKSILNVFKSKKIDLMVMVNCSVGNTITYYALKDCVKIFIGPIGTISQRNYYYSYIVDKITKQKVFTHTDVANIVINSIYNNPRTSNVHDKEAVIFAINLALCNQLYHFINCLSEALISKLDQDAHFITILKPTSPQYAKFEVLDTFEDCLIDLKQFVEVVSNYCPADFESYLIQLDRIIREIVLGNYYRDPTVISSFISSGITIFYPVNEDFARQGSIYYPQFLSPYNSAYPLFFKENNWKDFVDKIWA